MIRRLFTPAVILAAFLVGAASGLLPAMAQDPPPILSGPEGEHPVELPPCPPCPPPPLCPAPPGAPNMDAVQKALDAIKAAEGE